MDLREVIEKYKSLAGDFGQPVVNFRALDFPNRKLKNFFGVFDEDYNISRFFHFSNVSGATTLLHQRIPPNARLHRRHNL